MQKSHLPFPPLPVASAPSWRRKCAPHELCAAPTSLPSPRALGRALPGKGAKKGHVREAARSASQSLKEYGEEVLRNYAVIDVQDPASHMQRDADGAGLTRTPPRAMTPRKRHVVCVAGLKSAVWLHRRVLCPEGGVPQGHQPL